MLGAGAEEGELAHLTPQGCFNVLMSTGVCSWGPVGFSFGAVFRDVQVKDGMFVFPTHSNRFHTSWSMEGSECMTHNNSASVSEGRGPAFYY